MNPKINTILLLILLVGTAFVPAWAQPAILLTDSKTEIPISVSLAYFEDSSNALDFEQVKQQKFIIPGKKQALNFGFSSHTYWIKFTVLNASQQTEWFLYGEYPLLDSIFLYEPDKAKPSIIGDKLPFSARKTPNRFPVFDLKIPQQVECTYYLKIHTESSAQFPFSLNQKESFYQNQKTTEIGFGIYYGILFVMISYNLFLFFSIRHGSYLAYSITIFFNLLFFANINGHIIEYFLGDSPWWANQIIVVSMSLLAFTLITFAILFLDMSVYSRFWYRWFTFLSITAALTLVAGFIIPYSAITRINAALLGITGFSMIAAGLVIWRRGNAAARFFLFAWFSYIFGGFLLIFRNFGLLASHNFFTAHSVEIGNVLEVVLLSFALADKYNILEKEKKTAQQHLLKTSKEKEELVLEQNRVLEQKVSERTNDLKLIVENLNQTNEELNQTLEQLEIQREITAQKHQEVQRKNDNITSSLNYARRIQSALLISEDHFENAFGKDAFFISYYPKDIVSGDFYWFSMVNDQLYENGNKLKKQLITDKYLTENCILAVADCTGHGVPGAFMTVIGNNLLDQIINKEHIFAPAKILHELDTRLMQTLRQQGVEMGKVNDGMDISILNLSKSQTSASLAWASAKRPLWISEQGKEEITEYKGDKFPIGSSQFEEKMFTEKEISLQKGDIIYSFTDGYADQFGEQGKMTIGKFRHLIGEIRHKELAEQKQILAQKFQTWKGTYEQTDDVLVLGIRV